MLLRILLVAVVFFTAVTAWADELSVYPVPAVFVGKNVNDPLIKKLLGDSRQEFINSYISLFNKYFPAAVKNITDKNKYKTFAAYIHIPRASKYTVQKTDRLVDIYLPLTMSINFTNTASGEVLYSYPVTNYFKYETISDNNPEIIEQTLKHIFKTNYNKTAEEIIKQSSVDFKPFDITAKIIDIYKDLYILDKGIEAGIAKGDLLSDDNMNQISIVYSDLKYSVAKKIIGDPEINFEFGKYANGSITQLKKPKILLINDFDNEKLYSIFSEALGHNAEFSLVNTNKTFYDMQTALVSLNNNFKMSNIYNKSTPDYFLKLYFLTPFYAQYKSQKEYYNVDRYGMIACAVIFDSTGRGVYSVCADDEFKQEVVNEIRFNDEANYEIISKNAFLKLAESIKKEIKFKDVRFKIDKIDKDFIRIKDAEGYLKNGNVITVYKKVKTKKPLKEVLIPAWDYIVIRAENGFADCKMSIPYFDTIDNPKKKDIAKITAITKSANKANMLAYNPKNIELEGNRIKLTDFDKIAFASLVSSLEAPIMMQSSDYEDEIKKLNAFGYKKKIKINRNNNLADIKVVYKITPVSEEVKENVIKKEYEIIVGIISERAGAVIKQNAIMQTVAFVVPKENNDKVIEHELIKSCCLLIKKLAGDF